MKRIKDINGKALTKFDMVYIMLHTDHRSTKHGYDYYNNYYIFVDAFTYTEIANIYINEFKK